MVSFLSEVVFKFYLNLVGEFMDERLVGGEGAREQGTSSSAFPGICTTRGEMECPSQHFLPVFSCTKRDLWVDPRIPGWVKLEVTTGVTWIVGKDTEFKFFVQL